MLENYCKTIDGVVAQVNQVPYVYDALYIENRYSAFPDRGNLANLRLGYIIGSIGCIPMSLLDVGYGDSTFVDNCTKTIPKVYAYDLPTNTTATLGIRTNSLDIPVEVMTFFDSLEHFEDISFVQHVRATYIVISVPCCKHPDNDKWFKSWKHRKPNEHLFHFNAESLTAFMLRMGYAKINHTYLEDSIRVDPDNKPNILTSCFARII